MITDYTKRLLLLTAALMFTGSLLFSHAAEQTANPRDPIIGKWNYHGDDLVIINPDNTAHSRQGGAGTWRFLQNREAERRYEIVWYGGLYIDTLKLSRDGKKLEGKNQKGRPIVAIRISDPAK